VKSPAAADAVRVETRTSAVRTLEREDAATAPIRSDATLAQRPGSRHGVGVGAVATVVAYVLLASSLTALGLIVTRVLDDGSVARWDIDVSRWFTDRRTPAWDTATGVGSNIASTEVVVGIAFLTVAVLAALRLWRDVGVLLIALVLEVTVFLTTTSLVDRDRPPVQQLDAAPPTSSFPSGHTAAAVALYVTLAIILTRHRRHAVVRTVAWFVALSVPLAVALSRLHRGMHYPTDVIAGLLLGSVCVIVALFIVRRATNRPETTPP
jgi:undecaprenyl-diphosphatase